MGRHGGVHFQAVFKPSSSIHKYTFTMKVSLLLISISIGAALAHPATLAKRDDTPCSDAIYNFPSCCGSSSLSVADTSCTTGKFQSLTCD